MKSSFSRVIVATALTAVLGVAAVSCGGSDDGASNTPDASSSPSPSSSLSQVDRGEQLARSNGCAGCHGQDFGGAAGPGWIGRAGSEVKLVDGTTVIADTAYLTRAIVDPSAEVVAGFALQMPANALDDAEVADIVAYIESLADG